jgi:hypothetical protein
MPGADNRPMSRAVSGMDRAAAVAAGRRARAEVGRLVATALEGVWRAAPAPIALRAPELEAIAPLLVAAGSGGAVWRRVRGSALEGTPGARRLEKAYRWDSLQAAVHQQGIAALSRHFHTHGIEPLLVKGWAVARLYPEPGLRPYADVDLCVRPEQLAAAQAALASCAERPERVELHAGCPGLRGRTLADLVSRSKLAPLGETEVRVPGPEDHLRLLCFHMLDHGACRPLWLCDVALLVENRAPAFDWERCLGTDRRHAEWIASAIRLAGELLGAQLKGTPVDHPARRLPRWLARTVLRQWATALQPSSRPPLAEGLGRGRAHASRWLEELRGHWRNPIQASVEVNAPFNNLPRLPIQFAAALRRAPVLFR